MITVNGSDLLGMLTDLERTSGRDDSLPMLCGILLYTETADTGENRLYGTSTDRYVMGQAWEPCEGALDATFLPLDALPLVRAVLAQARKGPVTLDRHADPDRRSSHNLTVSAPGVAAVTVPEELQPVQFPKLRQIAASLADLPAGHQASLGGAFLAKLGTIARRRQCPVAITLSAPVKPAIFDIGPRYRALLMPVIDRTPEAFRFAFPPEK